MDREQPWLKPELGDSSEQLSLRPCRMGARYEMRVGEEWRKWGP